ncbi:hypothetical protein Glove_109g132 [Diversispora epigaea]|uniref:Uncharacterized protein n=1 Tax=Diversispora epigaea TaxID=1348612 RepID=A0A397J684_9GLOM|nr:hypothetical protein Glove_109g132 [Diversispora epigaea]
MSRWTLIYTAKAQMFINELHTKLSIGVSAFISNTLQAAYDKTKALETIHKQNPIYVSFLGYPSVGSFSAMNTSFVSDSKNNNSNNDSVLAKLTEVITAVFGHISHECTKLQNYQWNNNNNSGSYRNNNSESNYQRNNISSASPLSLNNISGDNSSNQQAKVIQTLLNLLNSANLNNQPFYPAERTNHSNRTDPIITRQKKKPAENKNKEIESETIVEFEENPH